VDFPVIREIMDLHASLRRLPQNPPPAPGNGDPIGGAEVDANTLRLI